MLDELDLTVPEPKAQAARPFPLVPVLLALVLLVGVVNLIVGLGGGNGAGAPASGLASKQQEALALKLERQGLHAAAIRAWHGTLAREQLDDTQRARIWYRIGTLHQAARQHEQALESFYTSESVARDIELAPEIARRTRECLEAMGKVAALRHELADRVDLSQGKAPAGADVVAEIGPQRITKADLDRMIEENIGRQLEQFAPLMSPEQRNKQKEALLQRFATPQARLRLLEQFIVEELLHRKAIEDKLFEDAATRRLLGEVERKFLAQRVVEKELAEQVKITPGDVQTFYQANRTRFGQPERAQVSRILVKDDAAAQAVFQRLKAGEKFEDLARDLSVDTASKDKGGELEGWVSKATRQGAAKVPPDLLALVFATEAGKVAEKTFTTPRGVHIIKVRTREPERELPFEEVRQQVYRDLRSLKIREVQERLIARLRVLHGVTIHPRALAPPPPTAPSGKAPAPPKAAPSKAPAAKSPAKKGDANL